MRHLPIIAISIALLVGCAGQQKFQTALDSWIGHDINEYMQKNGYATSSRSLPNGNTVYLFQRASSFQQPIYVSPTKTTVTPNYYDNGATATTTGGTISGGETVTRWCTKYVETDSRGTIVHWRAEGNNCY